jgi:hypothetical protein
MSLAGARAQRKNFARVADRKKAGDCVLLASGSVRGERLVLMFCWWGKKKEAKRMATEFAFHSLQSGGSGETPAKPCNLPRWHLPEAPPPTGIGRHTGAALAT